MTLTEFLLARIAEDEAVARDAAEVPPVHSNRWQLSTVKVETLDGVTHTRPRGTVEATPRRVLAECEAKRRIVERHARETWGTEFLDDPGLLTVECGYCSYDARRVDYPCADVADIALPYADHPDYRAEWTP